MEQIKIQEEVKYWSDINSYLVCLFSPVYNGVLVTASHKNLDKAKKKAYIEFKKKIDWWRSFKKISDIKEVVLEY